MITKILLSFVLLIVLVVGGFMFYLDTLVANGVESVGSRTLATAVDVDRVMLMPFSGGGSIGGLTVANPEGFSSPYVFELEEISVAMNLGSLTSDVIEVNSIVIDSPLITYEATLGGDNIRTLLGNIPGGEAGEPSASEGGKELLIREFRMVSPQINLVSALASRQFIIPDIVLNDIGTSGSGGATPREVARLILERISRAVLSSELPSLDEIEGRAREQLDEVEDRARTRIDDAAEDLGNRLRGLLDNTDNGDDDPN